MLPPLVLLLLFRVGIVILQGLGHYSIDCEWGSCSVVVLPLSYPRVSQVWMNLHLLNGESILQGTHRPLNQIEGICMRLQNSAKLELALFIGSDQTFDVFGVGQLSK